MNIILGLECYCLNEKSEECATSISKLCLFRHLKKDSKKYAVFQAHSQKLVALKVKT